MNAKRILLLALTMILIVGCSGGQYAQEKTVLTTVTKAMESFNSAIESAGKPEDVTKALVSFSSALETATPKIRELAKAHPDWDKNPPEELKGEFEKFEAATMAFRSGAMAKVMEFSRDNMGDKDLQDAMKEFSSIASQL